MKIKCRFAGLMNGHAVGAGFLWPRHLRCFRRSASQLLRAVPRRTQRSQETAHGTAGTQHTRHHHGIGHRRRVAAQPDTSSVAVWLGRAGSEKLQRLHTTNFIPPAKPLSRERTLSRAQRNVPPLRRASHRDCAAGPDVSGEKAMKQWHAPPRKLLAHPAKQVSIEASVHSIGRSRRSSDVVGRQRWAAPPLSASNAFIPARSARERGRVSPFHRHRINGG